MTNSTWGNMLNQKFAQPKMGYAAHHLEHVGENPMYQAHIAQAYMPKPAKINLKSPGDTAPGSPWHSMLKGK